MSALRRNIWVVVLAGGEGQRLRAMTANARAISAQIQYSSLNGGRSPLHTSLQCALAVTSREHIVAVLAEAHRSWWEREFLAHSRFPIVVEPCDRGTGLGVLLPLLVIAKSDPEADIVFIPSNHHVEHEEVLAESLRKAIAPASLDGDKFTLLGMSPNAPDSGFGYLSPAPDSGVGLRPLRAGGVWNSGIIAGRVPHFMEFYSKHKRQMFRDLQAVVAHWPDPRIPSPELASLYARFAAFDFASDILQKCPGKLQFLEPPCGRIGDSSHAQFGQVSLVPAARYPRLSPFKEI